MAMPCMPGYDITTPSNSKSAVDDLLEKLSLDNGKKYKYTLDEVLVALEAIPALAQKDNKNYY